MIITRTPFRISFFGGGTDYPAYYRENGGAVLSTSINKYCYIVCRKLPPFFEFRYRLRYSKMELAQSVDQIQHLSIRECIKFMGIADGLEISHTGDIPAMSGIGSSSAFTVGLLHALYALKGEMVTKRRLAFDAVNVEQNLIGEHVGSQDQTTAAFGGLNKIEFGGNDGIFVQPVTISQEKLQYLQDCMLLYFTGFSRCASDIAADQIKEMPKRLKELGAMQEMVDEALNILNGRAESISDFGRLLHESWMLKRTLSGKITNSEIDELYSLARGAGAIGGKLCGAGGGGFILFFVEPGKKESVQTALKKVLRVPFRFEALGSHVIFYSE